VCEEFLEHPEKDTIPDYKIYCFHGKPEAILVMYDRGKEKITAEFFDKDWNALENPSKYLSPVKKTPKPVCLSRMLEAAEKFSAPFPFVRCDFYVLGEKFYFGELTFTPAGGMYTSKTTINGRDMADYLHIP
jgi:hypothetical protein